MTTSAIVAILLSLLAVSSATDYDYKWLKARYEAKEVWPYYRPQDFAPVGADTNAAGSFQASAIDIIANDDPNGESIGTAAFVCHVTTPGNGIGALACTGSYVFSDGSISATYWVPADTPNIAVSITGGTGNYEGAYGAVYITNVQPPPEGVIQRYKHNFNIYIPAVQW